MFRKKFFAFKCDYRHDLKLERLKHEPIFEQLNDQPNSQFEKRKCRKDARDFKLPSTTFDNISGSCPDALLVTSNYLYAVEYERTEKKPTRYKEIVERYNRGNYHAVLFICRSQALVKKIKSIASSRRFYFITLGDLMRNRENAVFLSWSNSLPVQYLIETSSERDLSDLPREVLQYLVSPKKDQRIEAGTPWIEIPKTLEKSHDEYDLHDAEEDAYWEKVK